MNTFKVSATSVAYYDIGELHHEYSDRGWHRLVMVDQKTAKYGVLYDYASVALLEYKGVLFGATTEYHDILLPEIFIIHSLKPHSLKMEGDEPEDGVKKLAPRMVIKKTAA